MNKRNTKVIKFHFHPDEDSVVLVQIKGQPIAKAHEAAIELLQDQGYEATKQNVKKVEAPKHG